MQRGLGLLPKVVYTGPAQLVTCVVSCCTVFKLCEFDPRDVKLFGTPFSKVSLR